jgi:hypothetical protein
MDYPSIVKQQEPIDQRRDTYDSRQYMNSLYAWHVGMQYGCGRSPYVQIMHYGLSARRFTSTVLCTTHSVPQYKMF